MKKLTYNFIKESFEEKDCILLEETYEGAFHKLCYICSCGRKSIITWSKFQQGSRCMKCRDEKSAKLQLLDHDFVYNYFEKEGCKLITTYQGVKIPLKYICKCGRETKGWWNNFRRGQRCRKCSNEAILGDKHPNWNPDRKVVFLNKLVKRKSYDMLRHLLETLGKKKTTKSALMLGYSTEELKNHLTNHVNWNKVRDKKWSIDHIFPVKAFIEHGITDIALINCLDNLQPLILSENISKNAKYSKNEFQIWLKNKTSNKGQL
jgi:hypothetical protein